MARQNTFSIIPQAPRFDAHDAAPTRPMTSKQVRKAYKAATKTPTMTRAERIKWEREEQERIKKEYEKERSAVKARAAREKKKEKEMQQREEKRRSGLPLVNVRPSQDTIARFVRGNGSTKKRDATGVPVEAAEGPADQEDKQEEPTAHSSDLAALGSILEAEEDEFGGRDSDNNISEATMPTKEPTCNKSPKSNSDRIRSAQDTAKVEAAPLEETRSLKNPFPCDNPLPANFNTDLSLEDPLDEEAFDAALDLVVDESQQYFDEAAEPEPVAASTDTDPIHLPSQDLLDEDINTDMLDELDELLSGGKTPVKQPPARQPSSPKEIIPKPIPKDPAPAESQRLLEQKIATPPPAKRKSSQRRAQLPLSSPERPRQAPPTGTQAILVNLDDFFPTSSQQLLELEEERAPSQVEMPAEVPLSGNREDVMRKTNILPPAAAADVEMDELESDFGSFPSTAHFSLVECSMAPPRPTPQIQQPAANTAAAQPASKPEGPPAPPPAAPSRFFTSSGSREQLSLALQRSRRSAALEQIQEKERQRLEAGLLLRQSRHDEARQRRRLASPPPDPDKNSFDASHSKAVLDKENIGPDMGGSQETEYGGDWVEDAAWDLALC